MKYEAFGMLFKADSRHCQRKTGHHKARRFCGLSVLVLAIVTILILMPAQKSAAFHCEIPCSCVEGEHTATRNWITVRHADTQLHIGNEFVSHRMAFWLNYYFIEHILAAMTMMTEQLVATGMHQTLAIGAFMDAKHQSETIRLFQALMAQAHKDYHPDVEMCVIGTQAKSLASAQRRGEVNAHALMRGGIRRGLNNANVNASEGRKTDKEGRLEVFKDTFCNEHDNNDDLGPLCNGSGPAEFVNKDIDYGGLVDRPWTINADYTDTPAADQDSALLALYQYLYGHDVFDPIHPDGLQNLTNQTKLLDVRAITAKRSVAQHSFAAIVGQKSSGTPDAENTREYMQILLSEFGIDNPQETLALLGERPSYYAQMEMLTRQIMMREGFYTNLYGKPVNIDRKGAAIQAVNLIQNVDLFESKLRNEAMLALLVEMELEKVQEGIENRMGRLSTRDDPMRMQ